MTVISRRRLLQLAAGLPLSGLAACHSGRAGLESRPVRISLCGQALMEHPICLYPYPGFSELVGELRRAQFLFTDLEVAIRTPASGEPTRESLFLHGTGPEVLGCLGEMGFNLLALANNHAWDFGTAGVLATRNEVIRAGFTCAGSGHDINEATTAGLTPGQPQVALIAAATGKIRGQSAAGSHHAGINEIKLDASGELNQADVARNLAAISAAHKHASVVIACLHNHQWGEDMTVTKPWARKYAQRCVDAGADLFVSHGAPLLHGLETYRGKLLLHGLGSLVFHSRTEPGYYPSEVWESAVVHCDFQGSRLASIEVVPVAMNEMGDDPDNHLQTRGRPRLAESQQGAQILHRLARLSDALGTTLAIDGNRGFITNVT